MTIPGTNLLATALSLISKQSVQYYRYLSRDENSIGQYSANYAAPVTIKGSFQAVPRNLYSQYELDLSKEYAVFYSVNPIMSLERNRTGDYLVYNSQYWKCESDTNWFPQDSWKGVMVCRQLTPPV